MIQRKTMSNLLRGPTLCEQPFNLLAQPGTSGKLCCSWPTCLLDRPPFSPPCPIPTPRSVPRDLARYGRRRPAEASGNRSIRIAGLEPSRDLLALTQRQTKRRTRHRSRRKTTCLLQQELNRLRRAADRLCRLPVRRSRGDPGSNLPPLSVAQSPPSIGNLCAPDIESNSGDLLLRPQTPQVLGPRPHRDCGSGTS